MLARIRALVNERGLRENPRSLLLVCGLIALVLLAGAFYLGEQAAYSGVGIQPARYHELRDEVPRLQQRISSLESELGVQRTRAAVDASALEMVRKDLAIQREEIASLEEGIRFYRSLMTPGEIAQGLSLRPLELMTVDAGSQYAFRIVAQQEARKHAMLTGQMQVEVFGLENGAEVSYPISALSEDVEGESIALRFRYFQQIEGTLTLPEGFEPVGVRVEAIASRPHKMEARERFAWLPKEKLSNVPQ